jgi:hypothetical protein
MKLKPKRAQQSTLFDPIHYCSTHGHTWFIPLFKLSNTFFKNLHDDRPALARASIGHEAAGS